MDLTSDDIKLKVKRAHAAGYHIILVVGPNEVDQNTVSMRIGRNTEYGKTIDDVISVCDSYMEVL